MNDKWNSSQLSSDKTETPEDKETRRGAIIYILAFIVIGPVLLLLTFRE